METDSVNVTVFTGGGQSVQAASGELSEKIKDLVYEYAGHLPMSSVIGVLEIVKAEIMDEQK